MFQTVEREGGGGESGREAWKDACISSGIGLFFAAVQSILRLFWRADQPEDTADLEAQNRARGNIDEVTLTENMEAQAQPRMERNTENQQTQTPEQIPPPTAVQRDDDQKKCIKIVLNFSIGICGIVGSMTGVRDANEQKKSDSIFQKSSNMLLWFSFVSSVILMVLALVSIKIKKLVILVKIAMYSTIVLLILSVVDLFIVHMKSGNQ